MAVNHAVTIGGACEILVEWPVDIYPVKRVDIPNMVVIKAHGVIKNPHASKPVYQSVSIEDLDTADPVYPAVVIVVNGDVLYLYHSSVVVVLDEGVVVKSGIEGNGCRANADSGLYPVVDVKIKFPIRINCEGNPVLCKDERIGIPVKCR